MKNVSALILIAAAGVSGMLGACASKGSNARADREAAFADTVNGKATAIYSIAASDSSVMAEVTNFGGRIVTLTVPDRNGALTDVVLGFDSVADYVNVPSDFGASIGRYANRINQGRFTIGSDTIQLPTNNFGHCLHGGPTGWQYQVYDVKAVSDSSITLVMNSPAGDNAFPGNVVATVVYTLLPGGVLDIAYEAETDAPTVINMTNHSYFNLSGDPTTSVEAQELMVNAEGYTPVDSTYMTTGEIAAVEGTPFDFRTLRSIGSQINTPDNQQLKNGNGFDHNWVLATDGAFDVPAAALYSPQSGIFMEVFTTEPGIQVYTGNFLDGTVSGKNGVVYPARAAVCLETQHYPDSPNKPQWPSTVLNPGEKYTSHTAYKFSTKE